MKNTILLIISFFMVIATYSQSGQLKGRVFDATNNNPIAGADVQLTAKLGTATDKDGMFYLPCKDSAEITVSFIGYTTYKHQVLNCSDLLEIALSPSSSNLNEIEITASSNQNKTLLEQPLSIVRLTPVELKQGTGLFMKDAVNTNIPGVYMEARTYSAGQQFNIRGYGNGIRGTNGVNSNFDGQGSKVYLNGIPITDAEGVTIMDDIDFSSVGNVEVSKGPSGSLYGMAIAGVVNLQTQKAPKNQIAIGENFIVGSYGQVSSNTNLAIGGEKNSLLVNYGYQKFDGFMEHTAAHKNFVNLMGDFVLNNKQSISVFLGYSNSYDERNGELTIEQYEMKDYSGNPRYIKNDAHSAILSVHAGVSYTYKFNNQFSNTTTLFGSSRNMNNSSAGGWTDKSPLNGGFRTTFDMNFNLSDKVHLTGLAGMELQSMNTLTNGYKMGADSTNLSGYNVITSVSSITVTTSTAATYFTQWTLGLPLGFDITAGLGYSTMDLSLTDRLWGLTNNHPDNTTPHEYQNRYTNMLSPNVAINKMFGNNISVYASYSVGYKAPVSSYFFIPTTGEVNTGLIPERGSQIEIGTKGSLFDNKLFYTLALFDAKFADKMTSVAVPNPENTATLYSYVVNGGDLNNKGIELLVKYNAFESNSNFVSSLRPFINFTYSNFKYQDYSFEKIGKTAANQDTLLAYDYSGNFVAGVPPVVFNIGIDVDTKVGLYGNIVYNYRDAMYFTSDELNKTESYSLLNAKLGYGRTFGHFNLDIYGGANNIFSTQYYYMVFLNQLPDAYLPAPYDINFYGGINLKYIF